MHRGRVTDEAVKKATGKTWSEWFTLLDKAGAKKQGHTEIANFLSVQHIQSGWWAQMVTVEYERERGKRDVNQNAQGYYVSIHKTVPMSLAKLKKAWAKLLASKTVASKRLTDLKSKTKRAMIRYEADVGGVVVSFDERDTDKSRLMVEAIKLPDKAAVERERAFWKKALEKLGTI